MIPILKVPLHLAELGYGVHALGRILQFPDWLARLTPFGNVPQLPVEDLDFGRLAVMTVLALALIAVGLRGYSKRDVLG